MKYVLIALALVVIYLWVSRTKRNSSSGLGASCTSAPHPQAVRMVRCASCGVHLPAEDAIAAGDTYYCCEEHRSRSDA